MMTRLTIGLALVAMLASEAPAQTADGGRVRYKLDEVQGILAVQGLDGWLLVDQGGKNRIASWLVNPAGTPQRRWFYLIPATGAPVALVHRADGASFRDVPGTKIEYTGHRDLKTGLRTLLKRINRVGMEYAPTSSIPSLSLVDAATVKLVESMRVTITSSAQLVQFTKALWGPDGRIAHYIAAHHLSKLREDAIRFVRKRIAGNQTVTEYHVQQHLQRGYQVRGLSGPVPVVAVNENAADPNYTPSFDRSTQIRRGDLMMIAMSATVDGSARPVYADVTWMAYVGDAVPKRYAETFAVLVQARDEALALIRDRVGRRRPVKGFEVDQKARAIVAAAGHGDKFLHRTGHSIDISVEGDGANLDSFEAHDTRLLVQGAGFTIEPGVYYKGDFGMRAEINAYIGPHGVEVTTPAQSAITTVLGK